jgi:uncharacterized protein (TIGR02270 family)
MTAPVLDYIIMQHAEEATFLWSQRKRALVQPHYRLEDLIKLDERIEAHLEGLLIAGEAGWAQCEVLLDDGGAGATFAAMVLALSLGNTERQEWVSARSIHVPETRAGVRSALGWVSRRYLPDPKLLLAAPSPSLRWVGLSAAAVHRIDQGPGLAYAIDSACPLLRTSALRAAGEQGRCDLLPYCQRHLPAADESCRFWAAWSAVLLGDRGHALAVLRTVGLSANPFQERALQLALQAMEFYQAQGLLEALEQNPANIRSLIHSVGFAGNPAWVPWLIEKMRMPVLARLAGESFTRICGAAIVGNLGTSPPQDCAAVLPPPDDGVEQEPGLDPDENLPWPNADKVADWWREHRHSFQDGARYFLGKPISVRQAQQILRDGSQPQRIAAALYLPLLQPGQPLFEWRMPAWRQQRQLDKGSDSR